MKACIKIVTLIFFASIFIRCENTNGQGTDEKDCVSVYDSTLERHVYTLVDERPQYPGGEAKLYDFLMKNIRYPTCMPSNLQYKIFLTFIIEPDGTISNIDVLKKHNGTISPLDEAGMRVLRLMPAWTAGKCGGRAVAVRLNLPVYIHWK